MALVACIPSSKKTQDEAVAALNSFAFKFYSELEAENPGTDRFVSPMSASIALSLLTSGSEGATEKELVKALGFNCDKGGMNEQVAALLDGILAADSGTTIEIANSLWASGLIELKDSYVQDAEKYYKAEVRNVDFASAGAAREINAWVDSKTHGCIKNIIDRPDPDMLLAILNALYFKGKWAEDFDQARSDRFNAMDGSVSDIMMMSRTDHYKYAADKDFRMIEIPYGNGNFVMDVLLPVDENPAGFGEALAKLDAKEWNSLVGSLQNERVRLSLPKFKMEYDITLDNCLNALGIQKAYTPKADFSGISKTPLMVSTVRQKAYVDVTETGTEAAAVTIIAMKATSVGPAYQPIVFRADRPFVFAIREKSTGAILFLGQKVK